MVSGWRRWIHATTFLSISWFPPSSNQRSRELVSSPLITWQSSQWGSTLCPSCVRHNWLLWRDSAISSWMKEPKESKDITKGVGSPLLLNRPKMMKNISRHFKIIGARGTTKNGLKGMEALMMMKKISKPAGLKRDRITPKCLKWRIALASTLKIQRESKIMFPIRQPSLEICWKLCMCSMEGIHLSPKDK